MKPTFALLALTLAISAWSQPLSLNQALERAFESRPATKAALLALEGARHEARALGTYPPLTFGVGRSTREGLGPTDQDLFLAMPLDVFGRTAASRRTGLAKIRSAEADRRRILLEVQEEVMRAYFEASTASRLQQVSAALLTIAESVRAASSRRFEEGKIPAVQVTRATIELDRAKQTAALRDSQMKAALKRLAGAMGTEETVEVDPAATLPNPTADLAHRPDILRLEAEKELADADAEIARKSNLPELELSGIRTPWGESPSTIGARLQLSWRIFDFGRSGQEGKSAQKRSESAKAAIEDARKKAEAEMAALEVEIEAAKQQVASYEAIRVSAQDLVAKSQLGYSEGFGSLVDVLEATRSLREIEQELAEAQLALNLSILAQYHASGSLIR